MITPSQQGHINPDALQDEHNTRITCNVISRHNDRGRDKLVVLIVPTGAIVWDKWCNVPYFVPKETFLEAWNVS